MTFMVPACDIHIPTPKVGEVVSYSFEGHARRDMPVNPKIYRVRTDISWDYVVHNIVREQQYLSGTSYCC